MENFSQIVKLKGAMPPSDRLNGVHRDAPRLVADPGIVLVAVTILDVERIIDQIIREDGELYHLRTPVLRVRELEIMNGEHGDQAEMMMARARSRRMGGIQGMLPLGEP